jgi:hypothetical protein
MSEPSHRIKLEFQPQSCLFLPSSQYHPCDSIKRSGRCTHRGESHDCPSLTPPLGSSPPLFPLSLGILYYVHGDLISPILCLDLCNKYKKKVMKGENSRNYMSRVSLGKIWKEMDHQFNFEGQNEYIEDRMVFDRCLLHWSIIEIF